MNKIKINVDIKQTETIILFTVSLYNFSEKTIISNISDDSGDFTRRTVNLYEEHHNKVARVDNYLSPIITLKI
ncbi:hypothetical protein OF897_08145 [Chryseobacterium formosus]|uniref:Uncharacterized protein n=1 Tax=Chryseobacterium formosus TaxID=1537363 RepID=A0ABT3XP37_9FLAO|nr:hypothetical protein [Chryseobacterium formosus]MCX8523894.1 hypothetical protein [Chryseobacterium formosus]